MTSPSLSLSSHILGESSALPELAPDLVQSLDLIGHVGKLIGRDLRKAGLRQWLGSTGATNIQGEEVQYLDQRANDFFMEVFHHQHLVNVVVSEEMEQPHFIKKAEGAGRYALFIDPLDGSSNVDINGELGSIFSLYRLPQTGFPPTEGALRKKGQEQVAAGYLLYGPSLSLVYTAGKGVYQFTLDQEVGEYFLTASQITMPDRGRYYSVNEGNSRKWTEDTLRFLQYLKEADSETGRPYSARYSGCLVADVHRILWKGGLYFYPAEKNKPEGKLRLMYEAAPLTFVIEQAGGIGSTGLERIRDLIPQTLHQRVPLWIGSRDDVVLAETFLKPKSQT